MVIMKISPTILSSNIQLVELVIKLQDVKMDIMLVTLEGINLFEFQEILIMGQPAKHKSVLLDTLKHQQPQDVQTLDIMVNFIVA